VIRGADVVITSIRFKIGDPKIVEGVRKSGVKRYYVVGGAGSLMDPDGGLHYESAHFKERFMFAYEEANKGNTLLDALESDAEDIDWTMLTPLGTLHGRRTDRQSSAWASTRSSPTLGKSRNSFEDISVALLNETEKSAHLHQRFRIGY
jgi:putative NADH-flavin reductase